MSVSFEIPQDIEEQIRKEGVDLNSEAREVFLVQLYRTKRITHHQLAEALGLNRYETDGVLKRHGVGIELSQEEFRSQVESLRELRRQ